MGMNELNQPQQTVSNAKALGHPPLELRKQTRCCLCFENAGRRGYLKRRPINAQSKQILDKYKYKDIKKLYTHNVMIYKIYIYTLYIHTLL